MTTFWGRKARALRPLLIVCAVGGAVVGCGGAEPQGQTSATVSAETQQDLMGRWNDVAEGITVESWDFRWDRFADFPHPTFKGGSSEAYIAFARILVSFYEQDDTFGYLGSSHLFDMPLQMSYADGRVAFETSFAKLTNLLVTLDFAVLPADTLDKLRAFDARIAMAR
jgi:hypothetical protein